jgi:CBS domain-containing protein
MSVKEAQVRYAMTTPVVSVAANARIDDALTMMIDNQVSGLPVLDADGRLVGVITEYDLLRFFHETKATYQLFRSCQEFMTTAMVTIHPDASLREATVTLLDTTFRRLMVVENERLVGVLARRDVARFLRDDREAPDSLPCTPL